MPAEWWPHQATWLSWPHNPDTWPGVLADAERAMADAVAALAPHERVHINVLDDRHADHIGALLDGRVPDGSVCLERIPTDDAWIRDYGAIVVADGTGFAALDFDYNAWGGKYPPFDQDRVVASQMAGILGLSRIAVPMVLEGGSIDVNGEGLAIVTEQCLLNPNRNPDMTLGEIEACLADAFGLTEILWLGEGVAGDDTDGHVDNLARFVEPGRVVCAVAPDRSDVNHAPLDANFRKLEAFRDREGRRLDVIELPLPDPVFHGDSRLPASYANFYIANSVVLMPAYGSAADQRARSILQDCFPERQIVPIDCRRLIVGLGALHCLTQQIPVMVSDRVPS